MSNNKYKKEKGEFGDKFVKNEKGFNVVQAYPVEEYERWIEKVLDENTKEVVEEIESTLVELDIDTRARLPRPTVLKRNSWVSGKVFAINNITKNLYKKLNSLKKGK